MILIHILVIDSPIPHHIYTDHRAPILFFKTYTKCIYVYLLCVSIYFAISFVLNSITSYVALLAFKTLIMCSPSQYWIVSVNYRPYDVDFLTCWFLYFLLNKIIWLLTYSLQVVKNIMIVYYYIYTSSWLV